MQEAHLVELYRAGEHTVDELEELFGVTRSTVYALGCGLHVELVHVGADDQGAKLVNRALFSEGAEGGSGAPALVRR